MSIFIDTGVLAAFHNASDEKNPEARSILSRVRQKQYATAFTSDYVIDECTTLIFSRTRNRKQSNLFLEQALGSEELFTILYTSGEDFSEAAKEYLRQSDLSFTDCSILALMKSHGIKNIATFDSGFKKIRGVNVIEK